MSTAILKFTSVPVTSKYGWRVLKLSGTRNLHKGVDTATGTQYPHSVFGDGVVKFAGRQPYYIPGTKKVHPDYERGIHVIVEHAPGIETSYHSLSNLGVVTGQPVKMGDIIGYAGMSAVGASGNHVHNGLWLDGEHVDPLKYLTPGKAVTVTFGEPAPVAVPVAVEVPAAIPSNFPNGETVFIAIRKGNYYLAVPRKGEYTLVPLGKDGNHNTAVPKQWFDDNLAWATFKVCVSNPGILLGDD